MRKTIDSKSTEAIAYYNMISRCYKSNHKSYHNYGGRGIKVCDKWLNSIEAFIEDMGRKPNKAYQLERRDNNKDYCLDNCYWATKAEQVRNRRITIFVEVNGIKEALSDISKKYSIPLQTMKYWIKIGKFQEKLDYRLKYGKLEVKCGSTSNYRNGCRCKLCLEAIRIYRNARIV